MIQLSDKTYPDLSISSTWRPMLFSSVDANSCGGIELWAERLERVCQLPGAVLVIYREHWSLDTIIFFDTQEDWKALHLRTFAIMHGINNV